MKTILKKSVLYTAMLFFTGTVAQAQLTLTGEIRPRFEYRHGFQKPMDTLQHSGQFVSQRTRLNFGYKAEKFKVGVVLQDVRVWGNQNQLNSFDVNTYGMHEAWAEYFFSKKLSMKLGRQELNYDDERILGAVGWAQQARSHDAALLKFNPDSTLTIHVGAAYNQNAEASLSASYTGLTNYKEMHFIWINKQFKNLSVSLLGLNNGYQSPVTSNSTYFSQTMGTRIEYKKSGLFVGANLYYQTGVDKTNKPLDAKNGCLDVAYAIKQKFTVGLGYEYLSGQSQTDTAAAYKRVNHSFNPLYGTNHKFNGYMDYYFVGNHIDAVGLQDINLKLKYKVEKWNLGLDVHQFMAAADVLDTKAFASTGKYTAKNSSFGTEIDLTFGYNLSPGVSLTAGYSHYLISETLAFYKGVKNYKGDGRTDRTNNWAYVMISFKPNFMK